MTQPAEHRADDGLEFVEVTERERRQQHWGLVLTYGLFTFALGVAMCVWPSQTLVLVAILLAFQLIITGFMRIFVALVDSTQHRGARVLGGLAGVASLVIAVLFLTAPLRTLGTVVVLMGSLLILIGVADLAGTLLARNSERRLWDVVGGLVSIAVGGFLVISPDHSLHLLVVLTAAWLLCYGFVVAVSGWLLRPRAGQGDATT